MCLFTSISKQVSRISGSHGHVQYSHCYRPRQPERCLCTASVWHKQAAGLQRPPVQQLCRQCMKAHQDYGSNIGPRLKRSSGRSKTANSAIRRLHGSLVVAKGEHVRCKNKVAVHMEDRKQLEWHFRRRDTLQHIILGCLLSTDPLGWLAPRQGEAALLQFPAVDLKNTYYLVRAGQGESEAEDIVLTNPVAKTSMSSGLSPLGRQQVVKDTIPSLKAMGACSEGCWIWPSICQRSYQTAEIMATSLGVSRSRIQPEYSFLDARGLGDLEGLRIEAAMHQVVEGDGFSPDWRPPRGTDGTPNESVADVLVRVRQVLSITETQYRNQDVLIVSPDSDNLSVLQAALLGTDLRQHHKFHFKPGEVRAVQLSTEPGDFRNTIFSCPNPPRCVP